MLSSLPTLLPELAAGAAVRVLNRLLDREAWAREALLPFAGRIAQFEMAPFTLQLGIGPDGRFVTAAGQPNVTLSVDAAAVPAALLDPAALKRNVRLDGDAEFAQALSTVLQRLRPEPEEELAKLVGDAAAVRIVGTLRAMMAAAAQGASRLAGSTVDYLVAENPLLVSRAEADAFGAGVVAARDAVERLDKRLQRLEQQRQQPASVR
jgi:ubiquinone biosynthesis protein UbiJ